MVRARSEPQNKREARTRGSLQPRSGSELAAARFTRSRALDFFVHSLSPAGAFACVFAIVFLAQLVLSYFEGTLLPRPSTPDFVSFSEHLTVMVGASILLPSAFAIISYFYSAARRTVTRLLEDGVLSSASLEVIAPQPEQRYGARLTAPILAFVLIVDAMTVWGGVQEGVEYFQVMHHRPTLCGWYYIAVFVPLGYVFALFITDLVLYALAIRRLDRTDAWSPKLFHADELHGLKNVVRLSYWIYLFLVLMGCYFGVIILNWTVKKSPQKIFESPEGIIILVLYVLITPAVVVLALYPLQRSLERFKLQTLDSLYKTFGLQDSGRPSGPWLETAAALHSKGFFSLHTYAKSIETSVVSPALLAKLGTSALTPLIPIAVGFVRARLLHHP